MSKRHPHFKNYGCNKNYGFDKNLPISRRAFNKLSLSGLLSLACPLNRAYSQAANTSKKPKRFFVLMSPGGMYLPRWMKPADDGSIQFGAGVQPLKPFADQIVAIGNFNNTVADERRHHYRGMSTMLTGAAVGEDVKAPANGRSIDQILGDGLQHTAPYFSVQGGFRIHDYVDSKTRMVYSAPLTPIRPIDSPQQLYSSLFKGIRSQNPLNADSARSDQRLRVLDGIREQINMMNRELVGDDKERMQFHVNTIDQLERRIANHNELQNAKSCLDVEIGDNPGAIEEAQILLDLTSQSMVCGLTNVASYQINMASPRLVYDFLPGQKAYGTKFHHDITHSESPSTPEWDTFMTQCDDFHSGLVARFMKTLSEIPEDNGSMLDNTLILWCTPITEPDTHSHTRMHWMVAGGKGLNLWPTNRFVDVDFEPCFNIHVSLMRAFGHDVNSFGNGGGSDGPSSALPI